MKPKSSISIWQIFTLACNEASRLLSAREDRELTGTEQVALRLHLVICRSCRCYKKFLRFLRRIIHRQALDLTEVLEQWGLSEKSRKRIQDKVLREIEKNL